MLDLDRMSLQSVERSPNALVIVDGDLKLSCAQWLTRIQSVIAGLLSLGLRPGRHLLAIPQNRWEMATLHWACQFAGIAIIPLSWRAKPDELDYCICDADVKTLVFEPASADAVLGSPAAMKALRIALDGVPRSPLSFDTLPGAAPRPDSVLLEANDALLMLYTLDTTGRPKGVSHRHRQERVAALTHVAQNLYR